MQHVGGLQYLAVRVKHGSAAYSQLHELERHDTVVHVAKFDSSKLEHVDLNAPGSEVIEQRLDEFLRHMTQEKRAIAKVHAHNAKRLLLRRCLLVQHAHVHHDLARLIVDAALKLDPHPAVALVGTAIAPRHHCIGESKE